MAKGTKKRISGCKEKGEKILTILNGKKGTADVTEFLNTIKFVNSVLEDFVKSKSKERPKLADEGQKIEQLLKAYEELLVQLVNTGRFLRFFTSNRVRKNLDNINSQLHKEVAQIFLVLQENKQKNSKGAKSTTKGKGLKAELEQERQTECIKDDEGKKLWEDNFKQTLMVEWVQFISALKRVIDVNEDQDKQLKYILDNSNTGFVSMYRFSDFLGGFGPLKLCIEKVQGVLNAEWFHGFLSSAEAERLLEKQQAGTFLIRFSKSKPGSFAIAYVDANNRNTITHTLITCCPPSGFKIEEAYNRNARGRLFVTLAEVVEFYSYILKFPFRSDLARQSWFHGDLTSQEAEEILAGGQIGLFLFRFSSKSGFLAVSYVSAGEVKHGLLESVSGGYKFDNQPPIYPTLSDVVSNLGDLLKTPLTNLTFDFGTKNVDWSKSIGTVARKSAAPESPLQQDNYVSFNPLAMKSMTTTVQSNASPQVDRVQVDRTPPDRKTIDRPPIQGTEQYGSMPIPSGTQPAQTGSNYGALSQVRDENKGGSSMSEYGSMPIPGQESSYGSMPNAVDVENASDYGSMPNSLPSTSSDYGTMPGGTPEISGQFDYGSMPSAPVGNSSNSDYGSMPIGKTTQAPGASYGRISVMVKPSQPPMNSGSGSGSNQYGRMPNPVGQQSSSPPSSIGSQNGAQNGGAPGSPGSQYGRMPNPVGQQNSTLPSPNGIQNGAQNGGAPGTLPSSQYGRMPNPVGQSSGGASPGISRPLSMSPSQYGKMPTPGQTQTIPSGTLPPASQNTSPTSSQYGKMPTPNQPDNNSQTNSQYGRMPTPGQTTGSPAISQRTSVAPGTPGSQYGRMPTPIAPGSGIATNSPAFAKKSAEPISGSPSGNYGQIPAIRGSVGVQRPSTPSSPLPGPANYGHMPNPSNGRMTVSKTSSFGTTPTQGQNNYGIIPTPNGGSRTSVVGSPSVKTTQNYGLMPVPQRPISQAPNKQVIAPNNYGRVPKGMMTSDPDYGGLPSELQTGEYGGQMNDDYGGLPHQNSMDEYGGLPQDDYGGLPSQNPGDDYGGLPSNQEDYGGLPAENEGDYGGLPTSINQYSTNNDYGGLPAAKNQYPSTNQYASMHSVGNSQHGNDDYGGLPVNLLKQGVRH